MYYRNCCYFNESKINKVNTKDEICYYKVRSD